MDPALGKAADLYPESWCPETNIKSVHLPLPSDSLATGMTQEAGGVDPALGKAADLGWESRQMAGEEEWRPRKLCPRKQNDGR